MTEPVRLSDAQVAMITRLRNSPAVYQYILQISPPSYEARSFFGQARFINSGVGTGATFAWANTVAGAALQGRSVDPFEISDAIRNRVIAQIENERVLPSSADILEHDARTVIDEFRIPREAWTGTSFITEFFLTGSVRGPASWTEGLISIGSGILTLPQWLFGGLVEPQMRMRAEARMAAEINAAARELGQSPPRCFLAGTPILMADGQEKPIEDIRVGDMVMSFDPSADQGRGALVPKPVSRTFQNITRSIIDLRGLHMTPGHVCLTDDGRFETIAEILLRDGILVEADGTPIRARTGAKIGSMEDTPVLIAYPDEKTGKEIFVRARAGIPCRLVRERDGTMRHLSLALMLRAYHQTLTPDGLIQSPDGSLGEATDWPEDSTPMDKDYRRNWVIQTADGKPYVPEWILEVASEAREEQTVGATLQRIISPPSVRFTPRVVDNPTPPARNRAERRAQKHRGPK